MRPLDLLLAFTVPLVWGLGIVFAKAAIEHFPPILLIAFRFTVTALALVWAVRPPLGLMRQIFAISVVSASIQYCLTFTALKYLDAATAGLLIQLEVPMLVLLGWLLLKDRPGRRKVVGIVAAFAGMALMSGDPKIQGAWGALMLMLAGITFWALGQIMVRRLGETRTEAEGEVGGFVMVAWVAVFAAPQLFLASWLVESDQLRLIREADWVVWGAVVYLGLVMTAFGYGIWYRLLGRYPVSQVGPFLLLIPVASTLGGVLFLGETLSVEVLTGGAVIVAGVALILIERRRPVPPPP